MRILITGGAGFIGSHLSEALVGQGHEVVCVDSFNDYYDPLKKQRNIAALKQKKNFSCYEIDMRDAQRLAEVFEKVLPDKVVHLAAMPGVRYSLENPALYFDNNINSTVNLLELCVKHKVKKVVMASSSSVYGSSHGASHEDQSLSPLNPYALSKKFCEDISRFYSSYYGLSIICLRFFTVYGPRNRPDMAMYRFAQSIMHAKDITLYGSGNLTRDFTYIGDIVSGIISSLSLDLKFEIINLGSGRAVPVKMVLELIESCSGKRARILNKPQNPGEAEDTLADISKARVLLDYIPKYSIDEGVRSFWEWFKDEED